MTTQDIVRGPTWFAATGITGDGLFTEAENDVVLSLAISPDGFSWVESPVVGVSL